MAKKKRKKRPKIKVMLTAKDRPLSGDAGINACEPSKMQILDLIKRGKTREAVEMAKRLHAQQQCAESEKLLIEAYQARIQAMLDKNMPQDAMALIDLVLHRFPESRDLMNALRKRVTTRAGELGTLLAPLANPEVLPEERAEIEDILRRELTDLNALSQCAALPPEHPLRQGAAALDKAFRAVCEGPVSDDVLELNQIPRRSPLAPWKMLVRAIAHFYRKEDDLCRKWAAGIPADSKPAKCIPVLIALVERKRDALQTARQKDLFQAVEADFAPLEQILIRLGDALEEVRPRVVFDNMQKAISECQRVWPEYLEQFKQCLSVRAYYEKIPEEIVRMMLGGETLKNAYFWRLMARGAERHGSYIKMAPHFWEEFRLHALHEKWYEDGSYEEAQLYLHIAALLRKEREFHKSRPYFYMEEDDFDEDETIPMDSYYAKQPPKIRAIVKNRESWDSLRHFDELYERACKCDDDPANFRAWIEHAEKIRGKGMADDVALEWTWARPEDVEPRLYLMESAEKRNAFTKALKFLKQAEELDSVSPQVRRARLRLLIAIAKRHATDRRAHLLAKDITEIEALEQSSEGDRPAFVSALKWVQACLEDSNTTDGHADKTCRLLGGALAGNLILNGIASACKLTGYGVSLERVISETKQDEIIENVTRAMRLANDVGIPVPLNQNLRNSLFKILSAKAAGVQAAQCLVLAESALKERDETLAYVATGAGLALRGPSEARFLFLRAQSLSYNNFDRYIDCMTAAVSLARIQRDMRLVDEIIDYIHRSSHLFYFNKYYGLDDQFNVSHEVIERILERERKKRKPDTDKSSLGRPVSRKKRKTRPQEPERNEQEEESAFFNDIQMDLFPENPEATNAPYLHLLDVLLRAWDRYPDADFLQDPEQVRAADPELADEITKAISGYFEATGKLPSVNDIIISLANNEQPKPDPQIGQSRNKEENG